ncbi:MAG: RluA family pseudouridine synthase [Desulfobulbaceae bacterium]|uniref:Pseudouridine synthase n=1 Tax=Candidatus Desulfobia pelagia TaxID=2841692 RepID=A0A8J6TFG5_9BACT|nr:RluA family pseudouridine synthase [Candidatus Desulfobia pelagia]
MSSQHKGKRLDLFVADLEEFDSFTRSRIQKLIRSGNILVNTQAKKSGYQLQIDDQVSIAVPPPKEISLAPESIPLQVLYEDDDLISIVKPPGLVVHPANGHESGTLVHALLHLCTNLSGINGELRPGIVHRLDKDTSGVMVAAKNDMAHHGLVKQFQNRSVKKIYHAILAGIPRTSEGRIESPIGRHPIKRKKMAVLESGGRHAVTLWEVKEVFDSYSFVRLRLETGRTHQIRVHMASIGCPVAGDSLYGKKNTGSLEIDRQCLHSSILSITHPVSGEKLTFTAPLWPDMEVVLQSLRG